jgi:hypothetical protein
VTRREATGSLMIGSKIRSKPKHTYIQSQDDLTHALPRGLR